ncbi:MAG: radical SAM/SPASM domain-containing protein [Promethearchaeia archaeon]
MPLQKLKVPWRITFDTNPDLCNLNCIMCEEHSPYAAKKKIRKNRIMKFHLIRKVLKETHDKGLEEVIPSTMGEPLLYPHFYELVQLLKTYDLKLNLTTNGTFPRLGAKKWGKLLMPILSDIKVSINGTTKDTNEEIMKFSNYEKFLNDLKTLITIRDEIRNRGTNYPTITFQVTFMERNLKELPDLLRLAIEMGIDRLKGHHLWVTHPQLEKESLRRSDESISQWNKMVDELRKIAKGEKKQGYGIVLDNFYKLHSPSKAKMIPDNFICPFLGREAWIAWDGTFNVCCAPDNLRKSLGYFGNVRTMNFLELWNSAEYTALLQNWGQYNVCKQCNMRKPKEVIYCYEKS